MKISVIIPVYNCEDKIKRCVDSILAQGIKELEIILVNDGSIDNSAEVCNQIMKNEPRVKVIHQKNAGISEARNAGMKKAVGKYITFVDADDYLTKNPIYEKAINILEKENVEVVTWLWQYEQQGKYVVSKKKINNNPYGKISGKSFLDILYKGNYANGMVVGVWNKLYKRELVENEYFKYRYNEDDDWSIRVLSKVSGVYSLNEFGYVYTENVNSLTHQKFSGKEYNMLDILRDREVLIKDDDLLRIETLKLYCNLYIEYYYKAVQYGVPLYDDKKTYNQFRKSKRINLKSRIRFGVFSFSPYIYKKFIWRGK